MSDRGTGTTLRARNLGGGVAESNAPVAPGEVQESRPAAPAEQQSSRCDCGAPVCAVHGCQDRPTLRAFRKGDKVVTVLRGAGVETREDGEIACVRKGIAYVDNGPGNDPTPYDAVTGKYAHGDDYFVRWIVRAA